jgi:hypothetical protein
MRVKGHRAALLLLALAAASCENPFGSEPADPYERWRSHHIRDYILEQKRSCFCVDAATWYRLRVQDDRLVEVRRLDDGSPVPESEWSRFRTIEDLFRNVDSARRGGAAQVDVTYHGYYGYPTYFFVDPIRDAVDEEYAYHSRGLAPDGS